VFRTRDLVANLPISIENAVHGRSAYSTPHELLGEPAASDAEPAASDAEPAASDAELEPCRERRGKRRGGLRPRLFVRTGESNLLPGACARASGLWMVA
jgi:hypothetical protein